MNARRPDHAPPTKDTFAGTVERAIFHNADNGFYVLKVQARASVISCPSSAMPQRLVRAFGWS